MDRFEQFTTPEKQDIANGLRSNLAAFRSHLDGEQATEKGREWLQEAVERDEALLDEIGPLPIEEMV